MENQSIDAENGPFYYHSIAFDDSIFRVVIYYC